PRRDRGPRRGGVRTRGVAARRARRRRTPSSAPRARTPADLRRRVSRSTLEVGQEPLAPLAAGVEQAGHHGADGDAEDLGDRGVLELLHVAEQDDLTVLERQLRERRFELALRLVDLGAVGGGEGRRIGELPGGLAVLADLVDRHRAAAAALVEVVEAGVAQDAEEPRRERLAVAEAV